MGFLLFHVGIIVVVFTLSSLLAADGDSMLGMFQQLKIELINSTILHGTHVVCNLFSTNWFCYDCAYVFDLQLQFKCCGKESGVCCSLWSVAQYIALLRITLKKIYTIIRNNTYAVAFGWCVYSFASGMASYVKLLVQYFLQSQCTVRYCNRLTWKFRSGTNTVEVDLIWA